MSGTHLTRPARSFPNGQHRAASQALHTKPTSRIRRRALRSHHALCLQATALYQKEVEGNWVTTSTSRRPKAVVHFLGGAFAGAAPQLTYSLLIQLLAEAGYLVIATPFKVTFFHSACAEEVHRSFQACMTALRRSSDSYLLPQDGAIHGIGHSNGALLHLLIASMQSVPNASNVIISFNNKQVKQAIPIPLDNLQSIVRQSRSPSQPVALPSPVELFQRGVTTAASFGLPLDPGLISSLTPAVDQIDQVFNEVGNGTTDFVPAPAVSSQLIASKYSVPFTMMVRFRNDPIDETQTLLPLLQKRTPTGILDVTLPGNHGTPCGADYNWQVGRSFSLIDAVGLGTKLVVQADIRRLADRVIRWLDEK